MTPLDMANSLILDLQTQILQLRQARQNDAQALAAKDARIAELEATAVKPRARRKPADG